MWRYLLLFFCSLFLSVEGMEHATSGWDTPVEPASPPSYACEGFIEGVNVISGTYTEHAIDLVTQGIDPLFVERYYCRDNKRWGIYADLDQPNLLGWYVNYDTTLWHEIYTYSDYADGNIALTQRSGSLLHFFRPSGTSTFKLKSLEGHMNLSQGLLSGQNHLGNCSIEKAGFQTFFNRSGDGTLRCYQGKKRFCTGSTIHAASLVWELKPSGNRLYHQDGEFKTVSSDGMTVLNWVKINSSDGGFHWNITTSDNRTFTCYPGRDLSRISGQTSHLLKQIVMPDGNSIHYRYDDQNFNATDTLVRKDLPEGRFLQIEYRKINTSNKVSSLLAPLGNSQTPQTKYRFTYGATFTDVYDAVGNHTRYEFDQNKRITQTIRYNGDTPFRYEKNIWDPRGSLLAQLVYDAPGNLHFARRFCYDSRGNVTQETIFGPLTGTYFCPIRLDAYSIPFEAEAEFYTKTYQYSDDGFNLLTRESDYKGTTDYSYYPNTNLLKSKLISDENGIRIRQFRKYDTCCALTEYVEDDGNTPDGDNLAGCTLRKIVRFTNRLCFPGVGQPEKKEELYYDFEAQKEVALKQSLYSYNSHNLCVQEDVLDGSGSLLYSLKKEFDARGNCIYETDPLGNVVERLFDANSNLVQERGPRSDVVVENGYDYSNRLIWTKKSDGLRNSRMVRYTYDLCGNKVSEMDDAGNETHYAYDSLGREIAIRYPETLDAAECFHAATVSKEYDLFDNLCLWRDERGQTTQSWFTIRGKPFRTLSTGGEERFEYDLRGNLTKKIASDGGFIRYAYDFLDRLVLTEWCSPQGEVLAHTSAVYNAFFLLSSTDAEGVATTLEYDSAGREKKITKGYACTEKEYSPLGFLQTLKQWYGHEPNDYLVTRFTHDFLGRKLSESTEDSTGRIYLKKAFKYDPEGNCIESVDYLAENSTATTFFVYDGFGREVERQDPTGNVFLTHYLEAVEDGLGGRGACQIEIDPLGNQKTTFFNARGHILKEIVSDSSQNTLCHKQYRYDGCGNQTLMKQEQSPGIWQEVRFCYEVGGKPSSILDPDGSGKTLFHYDQKGNLIRKETPLTVHHFVYDSLGKVISHLVESAEERTEIRYAYDKCGRPTQITHNGRSTERCYDTLGNIVYEKQESGLEVVYTYDRMGRRVCMGLPFNASIAYHYQGPFLRAIQKWEEAKGVTCSAVYLTRDLSGKITESSLGIFGRMHTNYALNGKKKAVITHLWQQKGEYDPCGNLSLLTTQDPQGAFATSFSFDALSQLASENDKNYTYDGMGNRAQHGVGPCNQLVQAEEKSFCYDSQGRLVASDSSTCSYDSLDRMVRCDQTTYAYDGLNRRMAKNGERFLYDGNREIGKINQKGELVEFRLLGEGEGADLGAVLFIELKNKRYIAVSDIQGSIACLIDQSGKAAASYRYTAFGEIESSQGSLQNPWRFCSKRLDEESGWHFFGRRYYMANLGRFTTPDPLGYSEGLNLYLFAHNNPHAGDLYGYQDKRGPLDSKNPLDFVVKCIVYSVRFVERIGRCLIPLPGSRDCMDDTGRWGTSSPSIRESYKCQCSIVYVGEKKAAGITMAWINGVGNPVEGAIEAAKKYSEDHGNVQIAVLYNSSAGLLMDLAECFLLQLGLGLSHPEKLIINFVRQTLHNSPDEIIHLHGHSQGGLHIYNAGKQLKPEERQQIEVVTYGSAKIIPEKMFSITTNYYSKLDPVLLFSPIELCMILLNRSVNVVFLSPKTFNPLKEHMIAEKTYSDICRKRGHEFQLRLRTV